MIIFKHILVFSIFLLWYFVSKKVFLANINQEVIDSVNLDAGIFINQIRAFKELSIFSPSWMTAPYGYPYQYTFLKTDNFIFPAIFYSFFLGLGASEALAINLTKAILNGLAGFFAFIYLGGKVGQALIPALIYQNCFFLMFYNHHIQLQSHFVFPALLLILDKPISRFQAGMIGIILSISYFCSAYYFIFLCLITFIYFSINIKRILTLEYLIFLTLGLSLIIPFIIPQFLISLERKRNVAELFLYNFRPTFFFNFVEKPPELYTGFLGYAFTALLVYSLRLIIGYFGLFILILIFILATFNDFWNSFASWILPFCAIFAKKSRGLVFSSLLLFSLSLGINKSYPTLLSVLIDFIPQLNSIRVPVRYFLAGSFILLLIGLKGERLPRLFYFLVFVVQLSEIYFIRPDFSPLPYRVPGPDKMVSAIAVSGLKIKERKEIKYADYTLENQNHILKLQHKNLLLYNINSGYPSYKMDKFYDLVDSYPSDVFLRFAKSLGIEYIYSTRPRKRQNLKFISRKGQYFIYQIKYVDFYNPFRLAIPAYAKAVRFKIKSQSQCSATLNFLGEKYTVWLTRNYMAAYFFIPFKNRFSVRPLEISVDLGECQLVRVGKIEIFTKLDLKKPKMITIE